MSKSFALSQVDGAKLFAIEPDLYRTHQDCLLAHRLGNREVLAPRTLTLNPPDVESKFVGESDEFIMFISDDV